MKDTSREELFDNMLRMALKEYIEDTEPELKTEDELREAGIPLPEFSFRFEHRMNRLIRKERRKEWWKKHGKSTKRLVASMILAVVIGGAAIFNVDAFRIPIVSFFMNLKEDHSVIAINGGESKPILSEKFQEYLPSYVLEGFAVSKVEEDADAFYVEYSNGEGKMYMLDFKMTASNGAIDTEKADLDEQEIQRYPAVISKKNSQIVAVWIPAGHKYNLCGDITRDEAIRILSSVKKIF